MILHHPDGFKHESCPAHSAHRSIPWAHSRCTYPPVPDTEELLIQQALQGHLFHGDGTPPHYHHTAIPQFEPSNMVSAVLCVTTVVVCVVTQDDQAVACYPWGVGAYWPSAPWRP
eukprot:3052353-Prymnesium_polylepis.1